jgi:hypothetical protein
MEEENKIEISLNEFEVKDLNEVVYDLGDVQKRLGNWIFTNANSIEVSDISRLLHKGEKVDVNLNELSEIKQIVAGEGYYKPFALNQVLRYFDNKIDSLNKDKNETEQ